MMKMNLNGLWKLVGISPDGERKSFSGRVPGNTLSAIIDSMPEFDVFFRDNAEAVQKYEKFDWVYTKEFEVDKEEKNPRLVFCRLDTYCDVFLNGKLLGSCDNGFIEHKFDITGCLKTGKNTLEVRFYSPVTKVEGLPERRFCAFSRDRLYTRRQQCTYGWDWTMRFVASGIGDTYIDYLSNKMRVESVYIYTKSIDEDCAGVAADIEFDEFKSGALITSEVYNTDNKLVHCQTRYNEEPFMRISMDIPKPELWYPNGQGASVLYRFVLKVDGNEVYSENFGIRTVKVMQIQDPTDSENYKKCLELQKSDFGKKYDIKDAFSGFILKINGRKTMCKGFNWVPCEPFGIGNTDEKVTRLLNLARDAGVNMLRVWGGGAFESEHFYNECSRLGIMVTQDFLMACGDYPEEQEWFLDHLRKEAEYAARLIRNKPCLVWWSGDNENAVWGTPEEKEHHGRASAFKAIAPVLYKMDFNRDFFPSSPFGGYRYGSNTAGTTHNTQFLGDMFAYIEESDMSDFKEKIKEFRGRFIAEEPAMGAVELSSLKKFMTDEDVYGDNIDMWLYHTKNNISLKKELFEYQLMMAEKLFGSFKDGNDRFFKLKYLQYEWVRLSLEQARREKWFCSGIIYWMFNDCWPAAAGWAVVDYYTMPKAAYYSFKRGAKPVILSVDLTDGVYKLYICNDGIAENAKVRWYIVSDKGEVVKASDELKICAAENTSAVGFEINENDVPKDCFIVAELEAENGGFDRTFYKKGNLEICNCNDKIEILTKTDKCVKVKARTYIHSVELLGNAVFDENYFSLLPGEEREVTYTSSSPCDIKVGAYTL